jgi:hypothetical protein
MYLGAVALGVLLVTAKVAMRDYVMSSTATHLHGLQDAVERAADRLLAPSRRQWRGLSIDIVFHMALTQEQRWENVIGWYVERFTADVGGLLPLASSFTVDVEVESDADVDAVRVAVAPLLLSLRTLHTPYNVTISTNASRPVCCAVPQMQALAARGDSDDIGDATQRLVLYVGCVRGTQKVQDGLMGHMFDNWRLVAGLFLNETLSLDRAQWLTFKSGNSRFDVWWARQSALRLLSEPPATTTRAGDWLVRTRKRVRDLGSSSLLHARNETAAVTSGPEECDGSVGRGECQDGHGGIRVKEQSDQWNPCDGTATGCLVGPKYGWDVCKGVPAVGSELWDNCVITPPALHEPVR